MTVSVATLQQGQIKFVPELPKWKMDAIQRVKMSYAIKVIIGFEQKFWADDLYDVVCTDMFLPEFWMTTYPFQQGSIGAPYGVTGFLAGEAAEKVSQIRKADVVRRFLDQLDEIFGDGLATKYFVNSEVVSWTQSNRWIGGAYSYPTLGAEFGDREALSMSIGSGRILFAGEATHPSVNPCLQAAMETGQRAAQEVGKLDIMGKSKL
eukprot:TRINITY_DN16273_c0_g1_i4.p1 TRINITY_DN16273_c0_g1~~TRINITY_DN16273_c0_g1_i4.p1  ORF type:complete len:219 (+),score=35.95 TRINITY_DN16273_c0_g1_i4:37-657(+)